MLARLSTVWASLKTGSLERSRVHSSSSDMVKAPGWAVSSPLSSLSPSTPNEAERRRVDVLDAGYDPRTEAALET